MPCIASESMRGNFDVCSERWKNQNIAHLAEPFFFVVAILASEIRHKWTASRAQDVGGFQNIAKTCIPYPS